MDRRRFLAVCSSMGLASTLLPGALAAVSKGPGPITTEMMRQAERISGVSLTEAQRTAILDRVNGYRKVSQDLRDLPLEHQTPYALHFDPTPAGKTFQAHRRPFRPVDPPVGRPGRLDELAFYPVTHLSRLVRERKVSSMDLTRTYLARLKRYDPLLRCVVTRTEELALEQAARADAEIHAGQYRGPLHGIPWGVKDLFATRGIPTTWGHERYENRVIDQDATVVRRLRDAGAVLIAKLSLGELATGDRWYGGRTRNPWNPQRGSGGSSAGPAAAVAAGLVGFSIGTETNESLVAPALVCGVNGLRPTFGRVSRAGVMTVSWSFDKIGPMARSAEDCAMVLDAIYGPDGLDHSVTDLPIDWEAAPGIRNLRVGFVKALFDTPPENEWVADILAAHKEALETMERMGARIIEIKNVPYDWLNRLTRTSSLGMMVEAAAAHERLYLEQPESLFGHSDWDKRFRAARYVSAVDYVQANRARSLLIEAVDDVLEGVDVLLGRITLSALQSNVTGHPELVIPHGTDRNGMPVGLVITGKLFGESAMIRLARAYQERTDYHRRHPDLKGH